MDTVLTSDQRRDRARLAAETRWGKRFDWETETIDGCHDELAKLRSEAERGALILSRRVSVERISTAECFNPGCHKHIDITSGRFAGSRTRTNYETGENETAYACSAACFMYLSAHFAHAPKVETVPVNPPNLDTVNNEAAKLIV